MVQLYSPRVALSIAVILVSGLVFLSSVDLQREEIAVETPEEESSVNKMVASIENAPDRDLVVHAEQQMTSDKTTIKDLRNQRAKLQGDLRASKSEIETLKQKMQSLRRQLKKVQKRSQKLTKKTNAPKAKALPSTKPAARGTRSQTAFATAKQQIDAQGEALAESNMVGQNKITLQDGVQYIWGMSR